MMNSISVFTLDDEPLQALHLMYTLRDAGFQHVVELTSPLQALDRLRQSDRCLVVMDLDMPGMDGLQFIDQLHREGLRPWLACVSMCSQPVLDNAAAMAEARGLVVMGTFVKPFTLGHARRLRAGLSEGCDRYRAKEAPPPSQPAGKGVFSHALEARRIQGWFQPKVDVRSGQVTGVEVLARWPVPGASHAGDARFLETIRLYGLEEPLLFRMLMDGLVAQRQWRKSGWRVDLSVNLPVPLLANPDLPDQLQTCVESAGGSCCDVTFELLEDQTLEDMGQYHMGAGRLRLKGFGLAQDDFGHGFSSMHHLTTLPFTEVKIDRGFVTGAWRDATRRAALEASVRLGQQLGLKVTAEGVETHDDLDLLRQLGCDYIQGFLVAPAIRAEGIEPFLRYGTSATP
ncbi:EAL domain-containing response regulator [Castellaniella sp.]|uniref:EAL domain-containing response regulator n=1 Tax=Castellaniella sp. TaxID=1955812 RepID=UPI002AFE15ED|nr:EAL domain-containing response regulator [Castellaniella sp.]